MRLFPGRAKVVESAPFAEGLTAVDRLIRNGIYANAFELGDHRRIRRLLSHYWGKEAKSFHEAWQDRCERLFLRHDVEVIVHLEKQMQKLLGDIQFEQLYEIGCGGGKVLQYLSDRLLNISSFVGIDLGEEQIVDNKKTYESPRISFFAADANDWIPKNAKPKSVFLTNGGVFEYLLEEEIDNLFKYVATQLPPARSGCD